MAREEEGLSSGIVPQEMNSRASQRSASYSEIHLLSTSLAELYS